MRIKVKPKMDRYVFKKSADRVKAINLGRKMYRGGIRF